MGKRRRKSSMKRTVLRKVEVKVPVTHVDYKIWSWPRRSLRFKILQDGRKKTCTRPGTLRVLWMKQHRATSSLKSASDPRVSRARVER